jgi:hypothetical protein
MSSEVVQVGSERPIPFTAPMVRAILSGFKTQTRRIVKLPKWVARQGGDLNAATTFRDPGFGDGEYLHVAIDDGSVQRVYCPYADTLGDRLWVREAWRTSIRFDSKKPSSLAPWSPLRYEADQGLRNAWAGYGYGGKLRPGMFMPRWASRITLKVTGVRVERLNDISRGDAMAEGCPFPNMAKDPDPRQWYAELWDQINGNDAWAANPWVWCVEFTLVTGV